MRAAPTTQTVVLHRRILQAGITDRIQRLSLQPILSWDFGPSPQGRVLCWFFTVGEKSNYSMLMEKYGNNKLIENQKKIMYNKLR
jgi:hypothetical protein